MTNALDTLSPMCAPVAARWDAEADRRMQLRTPQNLKKLMAAQREYTSARATESSARSQRAAARKASRNPLSAARRSAAVADRAAHSYRKEARGALKAAKAEYPATLTTTAVRAHALHVLPAGLASWALSTPIDWAVWPASMSAGLVAANALVLKLGRRKVTASVPDEVSAEERALMERLDPSHWVQHAPARKLEGTVTTPPAIRRDGIECEIRLDAEWTVKKLRAHAESVRALLGARTELPMLIAHASRGGWAVLRLRTRSAAPDGIIPWTPGGPLGIDMVTGDEVRVPLGLRMLIAGTSGAGKSTASRPLLFEASEGPLCALVIIDLKKVEGRLWDHRARVASKPVDVVELVDELVAELDERLDVLPKGQATLVPSVERPRITVVVDEGAEVMSHCQRVEVVTGYTDKGAEITAKRDALEGLDSIARMGRAACIDLWWMTQSPTYGDGVPRQIAKQLSTRLGLAVESPTEARVVFGESAQEKGWKADELPMPGVAMLRDGKRSPDPVKVVLMADPQVIALPAQPIWGRDTATAGVPAAQPAERPALRLVKKEAAVAEPTPAPEPISNRDRVLAAVAAGARTNRDVTDRTGLNKGTVSKLVKSLTESGDLVKHPDHGLTLGGAEEVSA
ncbi:helix-turn-helix domain-containing protein [Streptomyces sp. JV180]|uniref:helix-turn-helix domain-containing protein n=1 Tax=Streptomyces sp. JV180 TaxID=858634 RepID=UPI001CC2F28B|nr:helix-turn-helix domain-containing protein [Streptomyces sp. JV180]